MKEIEGMPLITIDAARDETYRIVYRENVAVDISNDTDEAVLASSAGDFTDTDWVGGYIYINSGDAYNNYRHIDSENDLFLKSKGSGKICVVIRG